MELNVFEIAVLTKLKEMRSDDYVQASDFGYAQDAFHRTAFSLARKGLVDGIETEETGYVLVRLTSFGRKYALKI
jgi:DNA-binding MarR family transcriptional regulator